MQLFLVSFLFSLVVTTLATEVAENIASNMTLNFDYDIQKPYDVPVNQRYEVVNGVYHFWVYSNDKPHTETSNTDPRTEMRIKNDYHSGVHTFEGDVLIPSGTSGVTVFQVFGGHDYATAAQIRTENGKLLHYSNEVLASNVFDKWFHLKVQHDVSKHAVSFWVNNVFKLTAHDNGSPDNTSNGWYFKLGVYALHESSYKMESKYKNMVVTSGGGGDDCQWKGHCRGDKCTTYNDCDGDLTCKNGICG